VWKLGKLAGPSQTQREEEKVLDTDNIREARENMETSRVLRGRWDVHRSPGAKTKKKEHPSARSSKKRFRFESQIGKNINAGKNGKTRNLLGLVCVRRERVWKEQRRWF